MIVTKKVLEIYDKYDGEFGLMSEPWADKKDRELITSEQMTILDMYVDSLHFVKVDYLSSELRNKTIKEIERLEPLIDQEVREIIKERIDSKRKAIIKYKVPIRE